MKNKIKFVDLPIDVPVVKLKLFDGTDVYAILDSGSEMTLFDKEFVEAHKPYFGVKETLDKVRLIGLNNKKEHKVTSLSVMLYDENLLTTFLVTDAMLFDLESLNKIVRKHCHDDSLTCSAVIGSDTMKQIDAKIDYEQKTLTWK